MLQTSTARTVHPGTEHNPSKYRYNYENYIDEFSPTPSSKTVFLGIFTTPSRVGNRKLARDTWLALKSDAEKVGVTVNYKFVVGSASSYSREDWAALLEENRKYDDFAILEDVHDTYKNISLKLLSFLKYSEHESPDADFIGKIDDDSYLNLEVLAKSIRHLPNKRVRYGWFWYTVQKEESDSKYYDAYWKLGNYYPVYAAGPAHFTSKDMVHFINNLDHPLILQNDDVNIDVWLYGIDIMRIHDDRFHGGFNLCCKDTRSKKLDFIGLVNLNNDNMRYVHDFIMDPSRINFDMELAYYDCRCRIYHHPITTSSVIYFWIFIGIMAFAFAKYKTPRAPYSSHQYFP